MKKNKIVAMILVLLIGIKSLNSATSNPIESKIALENSLEKKLYSVLSEALGTTDLIVMISVQLQEEQKKENISEILPGIPQEDRVGEKKLSDSLTMVKKITANIIIDKSVSKDDEKVIKELTAGFLGISPDREDLIKIERMFFRKQKPFTWESLIYPPNLWFSIFSFLSILFIVLVVKTFFVPLSSSFKNLAATISTSNTKEKEPESQNIERIEINEKSKETQNEISNSQGKMFAFLEKADINKLIFIMKQKSIEDLTIVLNYAPENISSTLVEKLYPTSIESLKKLPDVTIMPPEKVRKVEMELKLLLDFVVGGEDKTKGIIESLDEKVQDEIITKFSEEFPDFTKKISSEIIKFSKLKDLEPASAQLLSRRVGMKTLAIALKRADFINDFTMKLTEGMRERFKEEVDLIRNISENMERAERKRVLSTLKQLVDEGYITFKTENKLSESGEVK